MSKQQPVSAEAEQPDADDSEWEEVRRFESRLERKSPWLYITPALIALNVLVFLLMWEKGVDPLRPRLEDLLIWGADYAPLTLEGQSWRLFTNMFVHAGVLHIALNMWALYDAGHLCERLYGTWTFLILYLLAGIGGSLSSVLWNPAIVSVGASGAILGIYACLITYTLTGDTPRSMRALGKIRNSTLSFIGYTLFYGMMHSGIDNAAHIGGLACGFVASFFVGAIASMRGKTHEKSGIES